MRYVLMAAGLIFAGLVALVAFNWGAITQTYDEVVALASEAMVESGMELGRLSYHAQQCGEEELMGQFQTSLDQLDGLSNDFQASMKDAFESGVEDARNMKVEYTEEFCTKLQKAIEQAQDG